MIDLLAWAILGLLCLAGPLAGLVCVLWIAAEVDTQWPD